MGAERSSQAAEPIRRRSIGRRAVAALLLLSGLLSLGYVAVSSYIAVSLVYTPPHPILNTPAKYGLDYREVRFPARQDHVMLRGWFIPGVLSSGRLTANRALVVVHGTRTNREDSAAGVLALSAQFARQGFAVLAFDMRGMGESPPAPISFGQFEQRDVLGAVDFLRSGTLPYPELDRPQRIGGWGVSMGAATLLLAAAHEPAFRAIVSDCAYADIVQPLERLAPQAGHYPPILTLGGLVAAWAIYGINYFAVRPVDVVADLAPRPVFFIHGAADDYVLPSNFDRLVAAANAAPNAHVTAWLVPGAKHAQSFHKVEALYVSRVVGFFESALGPDKSGVAAAA